MVGENNDVVRKKKHFLIYSVEFKQLRHNSKPKTCCILKKIIFCFFFLLSVFFLKEQKTLPINYFLSPLEIILYLPVSFGYFCPFNFHSDIDIKTQGLEGNK